MVQYIQKYGGKAGIISYDLYKAFDRVSLPFLYQVLRRMNFDEKFIAWIEMFHRGATTRFLLNFLTKHIDILISVRQGDPLALLLFLIVMEPLLLTIRRNIRGTSFVGEKNLWVGDVRRVECAQCKDESFVDDVNICFQEEEDLIKVDEIFTKFEKLSGAILNRDTKTKVMGLGEWKGKQDWILPWVKVVDNLKIFGIKFFPTYEEILEVNWSESYENFANCLHSWKLRSLDTIFQKMEIVNTFALPRIWYKAQLLPLPGRLTGKFEEEIRRFIWRGRLMQ